jgi:hypothetical protein
VIIGSGCGDGRSAGMPDRAAAISESVHTNTFNALGMAILLGYL